MSHSARDLLVRGIAAAKAKDFEEARFYLEWVERVDATRDQRVQALLWLTEITDDPDQKREYLKEVLTHNPGEPLAKRGLALLDGQLSPEEIVDPNAVPQEAPAEPQPVQARRFVCSQCGGRMRFSPDGTTLTCDYCHRSQSLVEAMEEGALVQEQDFTLALATAKGHTHSVATRTLTCQGCGVTFALPPGQLSSNCPYCHSVYVVDQVQTRVFIPPEGIIPLSVPREDALRQIQQWLGKRKLDDGAAVQDLGGVYFPMWTFDISGEVPWRCLERVSNLTHSTRQWVPRSGTDAIFENDVMVPASHALSTELLKCVDDFRLEKLVPYDPSYLADWPAGTYEVAVANASLVARARAVEKARFKISSQMFQIKDLRVSSAHILVEAYKLILVPLWVAHYRHEQTRYTVAVNGQTGKVEGERPPNIVQKWVNWLTQSS